ncbi:hypothetical protein Leryth_003095 [Lithospermum erythrorhizon]|nr:hypothetical protein Leryth_003095 [Lithospermum erythrorhizon]
MDQPAAKHCLIRFLQTITYREANLFKLIVKSYETKQYKKGIKAADSILKKFPNHGETLSMKGLTLNCMDRKAEAYELVRLGLKNDLKSHVCWHVYGLLYRSDRDYREAIKCYRNALRIDPENIEILRDLSLLQAQTRDLAGFVETRQQLLTLKANHRMNWIGFAVSHHLNSNGANILDNKHKYFSFIVLFGPKHYLEHTEGGLTGRYPRIMGGLGAKEMLLATRKHGTFLLDKFDKLAYKEQQVSLLVKLGRFEEGEKLYKVLLSMNPDNYRYYEGLQTCLGLYKENGQYSPDESDQLEAVYKSLAQQYNRSSAVKRIPLDFLHGDKFRITRDILEQLIIELENSIKTSGRFPESSEKELPSTLMWTLFYLAQEAEEKNEEPTTSGVSKSGKRQVKPVDPDPHGEKLLQVSLYNMNLCISSEDPLIEATKFLKLLQKHSPDVLETHLLSFEVNMRKNKILLALQAVKHLVQLDTDNPDTHRCLIQFFYKVGSMPAPVTDSEKLIWNVLDAERETFSQLHDKSLIDANKVFFEKHKDSLMHRAAAAEMLHVLEPSKKAEATKLIEDSMKDSCTIGAPGTVRKLKLKECIIVHKLLADVLYDNDAASRWKVRCAEYFPYSTYFEGHLSSVAPSSAYQQTKKLLENGTANGNVEKLEALKI